MGMIKEYTWKVKRYKGLSFVLSVRSVRIFRCDFIVSTDAIVFWFSPKNNYRTWSWHLLLVYGKFVFLRFLKETLSTAALPPPWELLFLMVVWPFEWGSLLSEIARLSCFLPRTRGLPFFPPAHNWAALLLSAIMEAQLPCKGLGWLEKALYSRSSDLVYQGWLLKLQLQLQKVCSSKDCSSLLWYLAPETKALRNKSWWPHDDPAYICFTEISWFCI